MADKQWGSDTGKWDYAREAANTIAALKSWCMDAAGHVKGLSSVRATRTSGPPSVVNSGTTYRTYR